MGQNKDFRAVYLTEYAKEKRLAAERRNNLIMSIFFGVVIGFGFMALSVASGLEDARRIEAERAVY